MTRRPSSYLDLLLAPALRPHPQAAWRPAADVYRCDHGWLLKFDLAGVREEDIQICVAGSSVTVSGTRRDWRIYDRQEAHLMEIAYSHFERSVQLPDDLGQATVRTEYRDGMLLVHVTPAQP